MIAVVSLPTASSLLSWSNRLYVTGSFLTLASAAVALYEQWSKNQGRLAHWKHRTHIFVIIAAFLSFSGSVLAITFSNVVSHLKDVDLATYKKQADVQIAQAEKDAANANQDAEADKKANLQLQNDLAQHESNEKALDANLTKANKETSDFAHSLQQQQATMEEQAKVSPVLTGFQIQQLSTALMGFSGQDVIFHSTADTTVLRLKQTIAMGLQGAGITFKENSMDMGALYQGVSVAVHSPQDVPPFANALVMGLRQAGIDVHPVAAPQMVPEGKVAIFLGPN